MVTTLKLARIKKDFTQGYLAKKLGISQGQYSLIERGVKPVPQHIADKVKRELDVDSQNWERIGG